VRALTLWQPWASLVFGNAKPYEFRGRSYRTYPNAPRPGDRIAIHAAARPVRREEVAQLFGNLGTQQDRTGLIKDAARRILEPVWLAFEASRRPVLREVLPLGVVLGTVIIGEPRKADEIFGWRPEDMDVEFNWAWPLGEIEKFVVPVPSRGMQGFWRWHNGGFVQSFSEGRANPSS
jgi:hypothetical protein